MLRRAIFCVILFTFSLMAVVTGCSSGSKTADVTGTITVDGEPAEKGSIEFFPADGASATGGGKIVEGGKYTGTSSVGVMNVKIRIPKVSGKKKLYDNGDVYQTTYKESLPPKYNDKTELSFEVKSGSNEKDWSLSTK